MNHIAWSLGGLLQTTLLDAEDRDAAQRLPRELFVVVPLCVCDGPASSIMATTTKTAMKKSERNRHKHSLLFTCRFLLKNCCRGVSRFWYRCHWA